MGMYTLAAHEGYWLSSYQLDNGMTALHLASVVQRYRNWVLGGVLDSPCCIVAVYPGQASVV